MMQGNDVIVNDNEIMTKDNNDNAIHNDAMTKGNDAEKDNVQL